MIKIKKFILKKLSFLFDDITKLKKYNTCFYKFTEYLVEGTHGEIIKGYNRITKKDVILKLINKRHKTTIKKEFHYYFLNIYHKNLIRYNNIFKKQKNCQIIMNYYEQDLFYYFTDDKENFKKLTNNDIRLIVYQILCGLNCLSKYNIYHADIKLENVILSKKNSLQNLKLIDFSNYVYIPKSLPCKELNHCCNYGTVDYYAPEIKDSKFYKNSDVWSVGVLTYVLLSGKFIKSNNQNNINKMISNLNVSNDLKDLIKNMLIVEPLQRFTIKEALNHNFFK